MSWTEWTDTLFRDLNLKELKVDEAFLNVSNKLSQEFYLYSLSEDCVKCPFKKLKLIAKKKDTVIKLNVARNLEMRLFEKDFGPYVFPNETSNGVRWSAQPELGEFGVYDLKIMQSQVVRLETAKEPVNIYTCKHEPLFFNVTQLDFFPLSAIFFVACVLIAFYWICKGVNKFYLRASEPEASTDANHQSTDNELDMQRTKKRLKSLDIFRGIAIVLMIFVNSGGGHYWWIEHAVWNGLHFADLVFPWFLFIMGTCIPLSIKSQISRQIPTKEIVGKIIKVTEHETDEI